MEGIEKPHMDKYKEIANYWNYDTNCTLTSLPDWDLEKLKCLIFCCKECTLQICATRDYDKVHGSNKFL
jgi:hypothetical protein